MVIVSIHQLIKVSEIFTTSKEASQIFMKDVLFNSMENTVFILVIDCELPTQSSVPFIV